MSDLNLEDKLCKNLEDSCIKAYNAGQQSMQAKIDELEQWNKNQYQLIQQKESENQSLKELLQKLLDDKHTLMRPSIAYECFEALRGDSK